MALSWSGSSSTASTSARNAASAADAVGGAQVLRNAVPAGMAGVSGQSVRERGRDRVCGLRVGAALVRAGRTPLGSASGPFGRVSRTGVGIVAGQSSGRCIHGRGCAIAVQSGHQDERRRSRPGRERCSVGVAINRCPRSHSQQTQTSAPGGICVRTMPPLRSGWNCRASTGYGAQSARNSPTAYGIGRPLDHWRRAHQAWIGSGTTAGYVTRPTPPARWQRRRLGLVLGDSLSPSTRSCEERLSWSRRHLRLPRHARRLSSSSARAERRSRSAARTR